MSSLCKSIASVSICVMDRRSVRCKQSLYRHTILFGFVKDKKCAYSSGCLTCEITKWNAYFEIATVYL